MTPRSLAFLLLLPAATTFADTIKLKSGEVVEGKILHARPDGIMIEVQFSPTITEQRLISRKDIAATSLVSPDETAFAEISRLKPPETASDPAIYDQVLTGTLRPFLKKFPSSARAADVKTLIGVFEAERKRVAAGDVKISGTWYDAASYAAEKYQLDADRTLLAMKAQLAAKNYPAALNNFETLRRSFPNSTAFAESLAPARDALRKTEEQLNFAQRNLAQILAQRQATIDRTPPEQRAPIERAVAAENARAENALETARQAGQRFVPIVPYDAKGIAAMQEAATDLGRELDAVDEAKLSSGVRLVRQARTELDEHQLDAAEATLVRLKTTWQEFEGLNRLEQRLKLAREADAASNSAL